MMRRCPVAIKEVVESRSCRGAVMFGDVLGVGEREALVRGLGRCRWPWICAHGRRGVVPVVELGERGGVVGVVGVVDWRGFMKRRGGGE